MKEENILSDYLTIQEFVKEPIERLVGYGLKSYKNKEELTPIIITISDEENDFYQVEIMVKVGVLTPPDNGMLN